MSRSAFFLLPTFQLGVRKIPEDVGVIGGGPAGLLAAITLSRKGYGVTVFEEHQEVGKPRHCTGILSDYVVRKLRFLSGGLSADWILGRFREYVVRSLDKGSSNELILKFDDYVYVTDREFLEAEMKDVAESCGATVQLSNRVLNVEPNGRIGLASHVVNYDTVILAEGSAMRFSRLLGLCSSQRRLNALQAIARVKKAPITPIIYVGTALSSEFFGWAVPINSRKVILGFADSVVAYGKIRLLMKVLRDWEGSGDIVIERFLGGTIPLQPPCSLFKGRVLGMGDAVSSVKPLTGGGLYPIVEEATALSAAFSKIPDITKYVCSLKGLVNLLTKQHRLRRLVKHLGGYSRIVGLLMELGLTKIRVRKYDSLDIDLLHSLASFRLLR